MWWGPCLLSPVLQKHMLFVHLLITTHCCACAEKQSPWGEPALSSIMSYKVLPCREHGLFPAESRCMNGWIVIFRAFKPKITGVHQLLCWCSNCSKPGGSSEQAKPSVGAAFASEPEHEDWCPKIYNCWKGLSHMWELFASCHDIAGRALPCPMAASSPFLCASSCHFLLQLNRMVPCCALSLSASLCSAVQRFIRHRISTTRKMCDIWNVASEGASSHKYVRASSWQKLRDRESRTLKICLYFKVRTGIPNAKLDNFSASLQLLFKAELSGKSWAMGLRWAPACWSLFQGHCRNKSLGLWSALLVLQLIPSRELQSQAKPAVSLHFCVCKGNWVKLSLAATSSM